MKKMYSIGNTARITKVSVKQLRNWEKQQYLNDIQRVICGERAYRYYSSKQVQQIKRIKELLDMGFTLKAASKLTTEQLN